jgi:hypothetical protein
MRRGVERNLIPAAIAAAVVGILIALLPGGCSGRTVTRVSTTPRPSTVEAPPPIDTTPSSYSTPTLITPEPEPTPPAAGGGVDRTPTPNYLTMTPRMPGTPILLTTPSPGAGASPRLTYTP